MKEKMALTEHTEFTEIIAKPEKAWPENFCAAQKYSGHILPLCSLWTLASFASE